MIDPLLPAESRGDILSIEKLTSSVVRNGISAWRILRRGRRYPAREDLAPVQIAPILRNILISEKLEDDADYAFRYVGENLVRGLDGDFTGRRLSQMIDSAPKFGLGLRMLYDMVRASGEPLGYRGWVGNDLPGAPIVYHETVILPLGPDDSVVDHLLSVSHLLPRRAAGA